MIEAGGGDFRAFSGFGEDEGSLKDRLGVEGETSRGPVGNNAVFPDRLSNVGLESRGVIGDALFTGLTDRRMRSVDFLHHGSDKAGEIGQITLKQRFAEFDVGRGDQPVIDRVRLRKDLR
jgi:hypothetical protein